MFSLASFAALAFLATTSPMDVPDPRPEHHVADLTGTLSADDVATIDGIAKQAAEHGELFVVVVPSTDGVNPREWTTVLFNRLRLDTKDRNRGVVLMAALKDRKAEIVIGDGYAPGTEGYTDTIMQNVVVFHFKKGDARGAIVEGARALQQRVVAQGAPSTVAQAAPVDPEIVAAAAHPAVVAVRAPSDTDNPVDMAKALTPLAALEIHTANAHMSEGTALATVVVSDTAELSPRVFAHGLAHRLGITNAAPGSGMGRVVLMVVVAPKAKKAKPAKGKANAPVAPVGPVAPAIEIVLGNGLPKSAIDVDTVMAAWRSAVAADPKHSKETISQATASAASSLKEVGMALAMHNAEQQRLADEKEREAAQWRAQMAARQAEQEHAREQDGMNRFFDDDNPLAWGVGGAGVFGLFLGGREVLRRRPRSCKKCNVRMHRLAEEVDDKHLEAGERTEERLGSVDYDIWCCGQCGEILKTRWGAIFTSYSRCNSCSWKTMSSTSRTITSATTYSTGLAEVTERCSHCSYSRTYTRVIPRVQKSSSSSSSGGRSSGGGGGFSSGRGSSGSW